MANSYHAHVYVANAKGNKANKLLDVGVRYDLA